MTEGKIEALSTGDLRIEPEQKGGTLVLIWKGKGTDRSPGTTITPWLTTCVENAKETASALHIDVGGIDHMNSATITTLVQIIREARTREVKLTLLYDPRKSWQELSFGALSMFVKDDGYFALGKL